MLNLIVNKGPDCGRVYTLDEGNSHLLGRFNRVMSVFVSDLKVSRIHAEVTNKKNQWFLRDMQSTNGTFVNGKRVREQVALNQHDQIRIGSTVFVVDILTAPKNNGHGRDQRSYKVKGPSLPSSGSTSRSPRVSQPNVSFSAVHHTPLRLRLAAALRSWQTIPSVFGTAR